MGAWSLDDIPWHAFDRSKVEAELLRAVKAAALVEMNSRDYVVYLHNVFGDDPAFRAAASQWGEEEAQHGLALGRWAEMADPEFDFKDAFRRFRAGYSLDLATDASVRGSRAGELVARCVVESGTSSFYTAIKDATEEPVLKRVAGLIAADEFRHYKLFYDHLQPYAKAERPSRLARLKIALGRVQEAEDDELAMAYYCGNVPAAREAEIPYDRKRFARAYEARASRLYQRRHIERAASMIMKAADFAPHGRIAKGLASVVWTILRHRTRGRLAPA